MDFMFLNTSFLLTGFDYIVILCTYIILIQKPGIIGEGAMFDSVNTGYRSLYVYGVCTCTDERSRDLWEGEHL